MDGAVKLGATDVLGQEATVQAVQGERFGRVARGPANIDNELQVVIRWDDGGTTSGWIKASEVELRYPEVTIREEAFAARCRARSDETVDGDAGRHRSSGWFEKLRLELVEERSCATDLYACCGL